MKTRLFLSVYLFLSAMNVYSFKSYFGKEFTKWYIFYDGLMCPNTFNYLTCSNRTTVIEGKTYQLLYDINEFQETDTINSMPANAYTDKYLREDTINGRLYYRHQIYSDYSISYSPEILVSDMTWKAGDSVRLNVTTSHSASWHNIKTPTNGNRYCAVIDTVYFKGGLKHLRTSATFNSQETLFGKQKDTLIFVEGIGSNLSPILDYEGLAYLSDIWKLMCHLKDNNATHFNSSGQCNLRELICDVGLRNVDENTSVSARLFPGQIKLMFNQPFLGRVRLFQQTGLMLYETPLTICSEHNIDTQNMPKGFYILQVFSGVHDVFTLKISI